MKSALDLIVYWAALPLICLLSLLPVRWAVFLGKHAGRVAYEFDRRHRLIALRNLEIGFPESPHAWREGVARRCFENFGKTIFELPSLLHTPSERILQRVRFQGWEYYLEALKKDRGVLILTGHIGNWELMALSHGLQGHRLYFVARPLDNPYVNDWINRLRMRAGNRIISKRGALRGIYTALRRGETVGLLMDQAVTGHDGVFVDFFGHSAGSSIAMAVFACRYGVPVLPVYIVREEGDISHRVVIESPVSVTLSGNKQQDILENTQRFQHVLEDIIRRHPEQWFWMHRRWKKSPSLGKGREGYPVKGRVGV
jgi:KDO2-lipid IV(A) lauroyltransferase